jgi:hypothetical protein
VLGIYWFYGKNLSGTLSPLPKNGYFKAESLSIGWLGKIKKNK